MLRAVLDTNVMVSALLYRGPPSQLVQRWQKKDLVLLVCREIIEEYLRVLAYPRFRLSAEEVKGLVQRQILPFVQPVHVQNIPAVVRADPSDDIFLACASFGKADFLVTGDRHLLSIKNYHDIPILSIHSFLLKLE